MGHSGSLSWIRLYYRITSVMYAGKVVEPVAIAHTLLCQAHMAPGGANSQSSSADISQIFVNQVFSICSMGRLSQECPCRSLSADCVRGWECNHRTVLRCSMRRRPRGRGPLVPQDRYELSRHRFVGSSSSLTGNECEAVSIPLAGPWAQPPTAVATALHQTSACHLSPQQ